MRPDGGVQSNPRWFKAVGDEVHFTHTSTRQKLKDLRANPTMSLSMVDPAKPFLYVELRGHLAGVVDDPTGAFSVELQNRYGNPSEQAPPDAADRIILRMAIDKGRPGVRRSAAASRRPGPRCEQAASRP